MQEPSVIRNIAAGLAFVVAGHTAEAQDTPAPPPPEKPAAAATNMPNTTTPPPVAPIDLKTFKEEILKIQEGLKAITDTLNQEDPLPKEMREKLNKAHQKLDTLLEDSQNNNSDWNRAITILTILASIVTLLAAIDARVSNKTLRGLIDKQQAMITDLAERFENTLRDIQNSERRIHHAIVRSDAATHVNRVMRLITQKEMKTSRIGDFPDMFSYMDQRVQNAQEIIIIERPYALFAVLGNPRGQYDFYQTLRERFSGNNQNKLLMITYSDEDRIEAARTRYDNSPDALHLLFNRALTDELLAVLDKDIAADLVEPLKTFKRGLTPADKVKIYAIAQNQLDSGLSAQDFAETLTDEKDKVFFNKMQAIRAALGTALATQEERHCQADAQLWSDSIVRVQKGRFDNAIKICVDGTEVITAESNTKKLEQRENRLDSDIGYKMLQKYKDTLNKKLRKIGFEEKLLKIINHLDRLIEKTKPDSAPTPNPSGGNAPKPV